MNQKIIAFNKTQRESATATASLPELRAGDVIKLYRRIKEGAKTRTQMFQGMIIAVNGGQSSSPSITIRKVSSGVGVELIVPLNSPQIEKIEFVKRTRARRSKLYFVRDKSVKVLSKKLKEIALSAGVLANIKSGKVEQVEEETEPEAEEVPNEIQDGEEQIVSEGVSQENESSETEE